jgi:transposase
LWWLAQLPHVGTAGGARSVVILDNASIHKCSDFVEMVNSVGGIVLYMPPYCFDLTPLDNGAFGQVRRWLQNHAEEVQQRGVRWGLNKAFLSVDARSARAHFRACGWIM